MTAFSRLYKKYQIKSLCESKKLRIPTPWTKVRFLIKGANRDIERDPMLRVA